MTSECDFSSMILIFVFILVFLFYEHRALDVNILIGVQGACRLVTENSVTQGPCLACCFIYFMCYFRFCR